MGDRRWTLSGDANEVFVTDETGRVVASSRHLADAKLVHGALTFLNSLRSSGVFGLNDDGSVWVDGGAWKKHEHYGIADSPISEFVTAFLGEDEVPAATGPTPSDSGRGDK